MLVSRLAADALVPLPVYAAVIQTDEVIKRLKRAERRNADVMMLFSLLSLIAPACICCCYAD
jgi:hypothetical protein